MKRILFILICATAWAQQTNTFPKQDNGSQANLPSSCNAPSFYLANDTGNFYVCKAGQYSLVGGSGNVSRPPSASSSPLTLGFGSVQIGTQSLTQNITITNTGTDQSLPVTSTTLSGSSDFHLVNPTACNESIAAGATCTISAYLQPSSTGLKNASLTVTTSANTNTIALTGSGTAAVTYPLVVSGTDTGFGTVTSSPAGIACVMAPPAAPTGLCSTSFASGTSVVLTATANAGSTFQSFNGASCSVSPCTIVMATPGFTVTADFSENAPVNTASAAVAPNAINFGSVQTGVPSAVQNITISNTSSTLPLTVNSVVFSGSNNFSSSNPNVCNQTLLPQASCVFPAQCTPTSAGVKAGTITVNTNAPVDPINPLTVTLSCTGIATPTFLLSLTGFGTGNGTVTDGGSLSCHFGAGAATGTCSLNYVSGAVVTLTATADPGSSFSGFNGAGCTTSPCAVTMSANALVASTFDIVTPTRTLNVAGVGQGTGTVTSDVNDVLTGTPISCTTTAGVLTGKCSATFNQGTVATLTEVPSGSCTGGACTFTSWGGATGCTTATTCAVTVNSNSTVTATFAAPPAGSPLQLIQHVTGSTTGTNNVSGVMGAQTAGNANIVYVLLNDATTTVTSITDTKGNTYTQSSCSPAIGTGQRVALYYSANILAAAASANTVTANLSASPSYRRVIVLEYSGLSATPADTCAAATGSTLAISSGSFTTTVAGDLLTTGEQAGSITAPSANFTQQVYDGGNDVEDRQGVPAAAYTVAPTQGYTNAWSIVAQGWKVTGTGGATLFTFNIQCAGTGSGTVVASGINVTCTNGVPSGTASTSVAGGSTLTLSATPISGSGFTSYSGAGCGTTPTCITSAITTNTSVTVTFNLAGTTNYYINSATGSDSNSGLCAVAGTPAGCTGPWQHINKAGSTTLTLGAAGTNVNVAAGTYNECVSTNQSGTATQRIRYVSTTPLGAIVKCDGSVKPAGAPTVWANGTGSSTRTGDYVDIVGFEITATSPTTQLLLCEGISEFGAFAIIQGNYVHDILGQNSTTCNTQGGGGIFLRNNGNTATVAHDSIVKANIVDNIGRGDDGTVGHVCTTLHGIYLASPRHTIINNIVSRACAWGIHMFHDTYQDVIANNTVINNYRGGIIVSASDGFTNDNTTVINNIVANNSSLSTEYGIEERWGATGANNVYRNNQLWGNLPGAFNFVNGTRTTTNNVCAASGTGCATVNTSLTNTQFVNYTGNAKTGNYLLKTSPVSVIIDAGATGPCAVSPGITPCVPSADFTLVTLRPQRAAYDPGAYEVP